MVKNSSDWKNKIEDTSSFVLFYFFSRRQPDSDLEIGLDALFLLFYIKRNQLMWFKHLVRKGSGCLPKELLQACLTGRRPWGKLRTCWKDDLSLVAWTPLSFYKGAERGGCGKRGPGLPPQAPVPQARLRHRCQTMDGWYLIVKLGSTFAAWKTSNLDGESVCHLFLKHHLSECTEWSHKQAVSFSIL